MSSLMNDTPRMRAERAYDAACDAAQYRRNREERDFRASRGYGSFLNASQYREMNRFVDRVMLESAEMEQVRATRLALYAIIAQGGAA